jgi:hypothetical protein
MLSTAHCSSKVLQYTTPRQTGLGFQTETDDMVTNILHRWQHQSRPWHFYKLWKYIHYCKKEGTPRKLATATQLQFPRNVIRLSWTRGTKWSSANWGNGNTIASVCAAPFSSTCSTQSNNNSQKLRLCCGCQFPWCALALKELEF